MVLIVEPLTQVAVGFSSLVFKTSDGACLKVARSAEAALRLRRSEAVLDVLVDRVDVEVPWPGRPLRANERWPYGAVLFPWLPGTRLGPEADAATVAALLKRLRDIEPAVLETVVEPYVQWCQRQVAGARDGIGAVSGLLEPALIPWLRAVVDELARDLAQGGVRPTVVHGDLWHENMLVRDGRLTGVLDWEAAGVGDPAIDLAGLWYLGHDWAQRVLRALDPPAPMLWRSACWRVLRELAGAAWSDRQHDRDELVESAAKIASVAAALRDTLDR
jgi:aminoglycoside phosphotransferase (APT) family kinase protein